MQIFDAVATYAGLKSPRTAMLTAKKKNYTDPASILEDGRQSESFELFQQRNPRYTVDVIQYTVIHSIADWGVLLRVTISATNFWIVNLDGVEV